MVAGLVVGRNVLHLNCLRSSAEGSVEDVGDHLAVRLLRRDVHVVFVRIVRRAEAFTVKKPRDAFGVRYDPMLFLWMFGCSDLDDLVDECRTLSQGELRVENAVDYAQSATLQERRLAFALDRFWVFLPLRTSGTGSCSTRRHRLILNSGFRRRLSR